MHDFYEELAHAKKTHRRLAVATVVETGGSNPRDIGAKMIILPDGTGIGTVGGGKVEKLVMEDALQKMGGGKPFTRQYTLLPEESGGIGMECGGAVTVFFEFPRAPETLLICGAGHIASCLAPMAARTDFSVVVADPRPEYARADRFPDASEVRCAEMDDPSLRELVDGDTYVVVVTHGHAGDLDAVLNLLPADPRYLGVIGSKRKVGAAFERLREAGMEQDRIERIFTPIGLDIGAETPGEISAAILAEMVAVRRTGGASPISLRAGGEDRMKEESG